MNPKKASAAPLRPRQDEPRIVVIAVSGNGWVSPSMPLRAWARNREAIEQEWEVYQVRLEGSLV